MNAVNATLILALLLMAGCNSAQPSQNIPEGTQCAADSDCGIGGCSGELCGAKAEVKDVLTACVYQQAYKCLKITSCGCVNGLCQWKRTSDFNKCVEANK
jgi:heavy-Cys/CGP-CTERM domain protein